MVTVEVLQPDKSFLMTSRPLNARDVATESRAIDCIKVLTEEPQTVDLEPTRKFIEDAHGYFKIGRFTIALSGCCYGHT